LGAVLEAERAMRFLGLPDRDASRSHDRTALTARERQVLALVAQGMSDAEIAASLTLSRHTVHRHVANIFTKLGCSSRAAAVARAAAQGLLDVPTA
jgi:DNA-binding CsgD family transcriptional regulator